MLFRSQTEALLSQAARVWFVSDRLIEEYAGKIRIPGPEVCRVLRPIPEGGDAAQAVWSERFSRQPVVVHSGALQKSHHSVILALADALAAFDGKLILVERQNNPTAQACSRERGNISHIPFFPTNREAVEFIAAQATAAVHMYSFSISSQGWATASFPSKLIEYSHTGIPVLLLSPPGTALQIGRASCRERV